MKNELIKEITEYNRHIGNDNLVGVKKIFEYQKQLDLFWELAHTINIYDLNTIQLDVEKQVADHKVTNEKLVSLNTKLSEMLDDEFDFVKIDGKISELDNPDSISAPDLDTLDKFTKQLKK
ncbi:hypothetical protein BGL34_06040 [Fructilactobacillus lindneri]|uniref:Uncharacterized protein n=2 Tax=Fructilactobacillus lindneri TaxID=53444 RepID=A0A0R2JTQ0_9LACO|nr:hypothetical protein [Fructilactobacillus lindneri]ANZ57510.1 hypothetical protein AYR60_01275 [Fructilactobacillus lindneri]ANZ58778.1 hypothetical protein AYR59_01275 [Fructilactobacillus lindneri]KRN80498.1 hypothetical protein IV52_GL000072 [Fructilactobacillus lindneri DSM 20690 = JCM 11027]POG97794.1 hypothetical protein BGL31_05505 [Fructilactobacillus lindneri]POG99126.1 hypothetical protein BGL32_05530 [Fructilactobacillus lindneri]